MSTAGLNLAAARAVLGPLRPDDLARVGVQALQDGCDSPSLRILAGSETDDAEEARATLERVLLELDVALPSKGEAVRLLAREIAQGIVGGTIGASAGAERIWDLTLRASDENFPELDPFVYAASEWEERPDDRDAFEAGIIAAAGDLVIG